MGKTILPRDKAVELIQETFKDNNFASLSLQQIFNSKRLLQYKSQYKNEESYQSAIKWNLEVNSKDSKLWDKKNNIFENRNIGEGIWGVVGDTVHTYQEPSSTSKTITSFKTKKAKVTKSIKATTKIKKAKSGNKETDLLDLLNSELDDDLKLIITKKIKLNKELASEIRARANHRCEYCGQETFKNDQDEGYLEVHHIDFLCEGGKDQKDNLIALCPTCHRRAHSSKEREEFKEELKNIVNDKN